jgi:hypothetical protein
MPPEEAFPPLEAAADCPPVLRFAHDWFHFADLKQGHSCKTFLEQDECMLAIFRDCSVRSPDQLRQWQGVLSSERRVELEPVSNSATLTSPGTCRGTLEDEGSTPRLFLSCPGAQPPHPGIHLEAVDRDALPFGEQGPKLEVAELEAGVSARFRDLAVVENGGRREIWALIFGQGALSPNGVHIFDAQSYRALAQLPIERASKIAYSPTAGEVIIAGESSLSVVEVSSRQVRSRSFGQERSVEDVALSLDNQSILIASAGAAASESFLESYDRPTLEPIALPTRFAFEIRAVVPSLSVAGGATFIAFASSPVENESVALVLDRDLGRLESFDIGTPVADAEANLRDQVIGFVAGNLFRELDPDDFGQPLSTPSAVPYFEALRAMTYDLDRDRVYVAGSYITEETEGQIGLQPGRATFIDLGTRRAAQAAVSLPDTPSAIRIEAGSGDVLIARERIATLEIFSPR